MPKPIIRSFAFLANWVAWVIRQPAMLITMVVGPFLILALFALSNAAQADKAQVIVVHTGPPEAKISTDMLAAYFDVREETDSKPRAEEQLAKGQADAVVVLPPDPTTSLARGEQAKIIVMTNEIDPIALAYLHADLRAGVADLNKEVQTQGVEQTKAESTDIDKRLDSSLGRLQRIDRDADNPPVVREEVQALDSELGPALDRVPLISAAARATAVLLASADGQPILDQVSQAEQTALEARATLALLKAETESPQPSPARVRTLSQRLAGQITELKTQIAAVREVPTATVVQPFDSQIVETAVYKPSLVQFYAPAALALLLQHFAVTLAALSMVRARLLGMVEFWHIAPIRANEIITGNYLSYGILSLLAWAVLTAATAYGLGVPILGSLTHLIGAATLLIFASLGVGFIISLLANNEQQAAQLAMLVLLGSVFLSGFVRPLETIDFPVRIASYLLPATFGIQLFQDIMLRGAAGETWYFVALGLLGVGGLYISLLLFRRELRPA